MSDFPIIEKLGGRDAVFEHLSKVCRLQTKDALRLWRYRGRIPGEAYDALLSLAEERGIMCRASDFRLPKNDGANP